jgi:hypothetical protein
MQGLQLSQRRRHATRKTFPECRNARSPRVIIMRPWEFSRLEQKRNDSQPIMKYALLVHQSQEYFDRRDDAAAMAAGKAYGEALQAAGVFVGGAGLQSPRAATTVSVRDGKRQVHDGPYAETKEFHAAIEAIARNSYGRLIAYIAARSAMSPARKTRLATQLPRRWNDGRRTAFHKNLRRGCYTPHATASLTPPVAIKSSNSQRRFFGKSPRKHIP